MKPEEIRAVEDTVNAQIRRNGYRNQHYGYRCRARIRRHGAVWRKYDDRVRVLRMGDFSTELCGGTHAARTGDIGLFRITSESGTAAGVRRIEAVTGEGAMAILHAQSDQLNDIAQLLKGDSHNLGEKVRAALERTRQLERAAAAERAGCGAGERKPLQQSGRD